YVVCVRIVARRPGARTSRGPCKEVIDSPMASALLRLRGTLPREAGPRVFAVLALLPFSAAAAEQSAPNTASASILARAMARRRRVGLAVPGFASRRREIAGAAFRRDACARPAFPAAVITAAGAVRRGRRRRIPAHGRRDGAALHHLLQSGEEARALRRAAGALEMV